MAWHSAGENHASRERDRAAATAGEGDHWSSRSERTVVEGARDSTLRYRCGRFRSNKKRASENVWTSPRLLRRVESCAPSTALGAVPLPRFAGAEKIRPRGRG